MRPNPRVAGFAAVMASVLVLLNLSSATPARFVDALPPGIPTPDVTPSEPPTGALPVPSAVNELRALGKSDASMHIDSTGTVRSITGTGTTSLGPNADEFVRKYAAAFGMSKGHTVTGSAAVAIPGGDRVVRYQQHVGGLPVLGGEVVVTTASDGTVRGALADTATLAPVATPKVIGTSSAEQIGKDAVAKEFGLTDATARAELWLHEVEDRLRPTYVVKFYDADGNHDLATVLVDAATGTIRLTATERQTARERVICDMENVPVNLNLRGNYVCNPFTALSRKSITRLEGGDPSASLEVNKAYDMLGAAYDYFKANFGRDSYDGRGGEIRATVRACHNAPQECPFENAFWDGYQFVFAGGWAVDDVVWHEYAHAVTDHASSLYYWQESGAINEALSDIFSELMDQGTTAHDRLSNDDSTYAWRVGENIPFGYWFPNGGPIRSMAAPNVYGDPDYYREYPYWSETYDNVDNGGVHTNSGVANRMAYLIAAGFGSIDPIGLEKSAHLWYRIMHLLSSGANYEQLVVTAKAACRQLIPSRMTIADCDSVAEATAVVFPNYIPGELNLCDGGNGNPMGRKPASILFSDDMESADSASKWERSDSYFWQFIPNQQIDYAYAAHGRGSLNGWTLPGSDPRGHGTYAQMAEAVTIPSGQTQVSFYYSAIQDGGANGLIGVDASINNGSGWVPLNLSFGGNRMSSSKGYWSASANLAPYAGQQVKIRFQVISPNNQLLDWYLDDFTIFTCDSQIPGAPQESFGYVDGSDLKLNWRTHSLYNADPMNPSGHRFDLTFSPAIPGAPEYYQPTQSQSDDPRRIVTVPGADPNQRYEVTVRVRLANGIVGPATTIIVDPRVPAVCPTSSGQLSPVFGGRRIPAGSCFPTVIPRRP